VPNPLRIPTTIEHSEHNRLASDNSVIDRVGKALRQESVIPELDPVDSGIQDERVDFGEEAVEEIAPTPSCCRS
jgi:hypothetical protein